MYVCYGISTICCLRAQHTHATTVEKRNLHDNIVWLEERVGAASVLHTEGIDWLYQSGAQTKAGPAAVL